MNFLDVYLFFLWIQKGTVLEKLNEEVAKDGQHLRRLIANCEGNIQIWLNLSCEAYSEVFSFASGVIMLLG